MPKTPKEPQEARLPSEHPGYSQSRPRAAKLPPVPGCPRCKRPLTQEHANWCPIGNGEALPPEAEHEKPAPMVVRYGRPTATVEDRPVARPATLAAIPPAELKERGRRGAASRMRNITERKEPTVATATLAEVAQDLGMPAPSTALDEVAICKSCGPKPRENFSTKLDGSPYALCKLCKAAAMKANRYDGKGVGTAIPQEVADKAYAAMTEPAETPIDTLAVAEDQRESVFVPHPESASSLAAEVREGAQFPTPVDDDQVEAPVIVAGAPVITPEAPVISQPAPIEHDIEQLEARLDDLRRIRDLMAQDEGDLTRLYRLVGEAIARKQAVTA